MVSRFGDFIEKYNIVIINDVYDIPTRHQEKAILDDYGLGQGLVIDASSVSLQPRCFIGPPTKLWLEAAPINRKDMLDYFDSKVSIMREILSPDVHRKEGLRGRLDLRTRMDETYQGEHTYEFGPLIDRSLGVLCCPVWWTAKGAMQLMRKRNNR